MEKKVFEEIKKSIVEKVLDQVRRAENLLKILSNDDLNEEGLIEALRAGKELTDEIKSVEFDYSGLSITQQYLIRFRLRNKASVIDDFMSIDFDKILGEINP